MHRPWKQIHTFNSFELISVLLTAEDLAVPCCCGRVAGDHYDLFRSHFYYGVEGEYVAALARRVNDDNVRVFSFLLKSVGYLTCVTADEVSIFDAVCLCVGSSVFHSLLTTSTPVRCFILSIMERPMVPAPQ